jgi:hypothetical protein
LFGLPNGAGRRRAFVMVLGASGQAAVFTSSSPC